MAAQVSMPKQTLQQNIEELGPWFHNIDLGGVQTAPDHFLGDYPNVKWSRFAHAVPEDLTGKTVLDIGCNAGFYSLEMLRRGAKRVVGMDSDERYLRQAQFVADFHGADIELRRLSIYDVAQLGEKFDLVLCMGVFYHLRHPLLALDLLHEHVVREMLLFQTLQRGAEQVEAIDANYDFWETALFDKPGYPKMHFIEHRYANDVTNWWFPNHACVEAMLRSSGFVIDERPEEEVYICTRRELEPWEARDRAVYPARGGVTSG